MRPEALTRSTARTMVRPCGRHLEAVLRTSQQAGEFRRFDERVMAVTIPGAIDALPALLIADPHLDAGLYARELATQFDRTAWKEGV